MAQRPDLNIAIPEQKNKASEYNENFNLMMGYCEEVAAEINATTQDTLSVYQTVNTLSTSGEIALTDNSTNTIIPEGEVTFTLPTITGEEVNKYHQILVQLKLTDISYITSEDDGLGTNYFFNGIPPEFSYTGNYDIIYSFDNAESKWCVGIIFKGVA